MHPLGALPSRSLQVARSAGSDELKPIIPEEPLRGSRQMRKRVACGQLALGLLELRTQLLEAVLYESVPAPPLRSAAETLHGSGVRDLLGEHAGLPGSALAFRVDSH